MRTDTDTRSPVSQRPRVPIPEWKYHTGSSTRPLWTEQKTDVFVPDKKLDPSQVVQLRPGQPNPPEILRVPVPPIERYWNDVRNHLNYINGINANDVFEDLFPRLDYKLKESLPPRQYMLNWLQSTGIPLPDLLNFRINTNRELQKLQDMQRIRY